MQSAEHVDLFKQHLLDRGLKLTAQRRAIAEVFFSGKKHVSLLEILELAKRRKAGIGYATVYRTMKLLTDGGLAVEHKFGEGEARFEPYHEGEHHDHLICVRCGKIVEFEDPVIESQQDKVAEEYGFRVVSHRHEIYGECLEPCDEQA